MNEANFFDAIPFQPANGYSDLFAAYEKAAAEQTVPKLSFLVDENLNAEIVQTLAQRGIPLNYVRDVGLAGHTDEEVFAHAVANQQAVISFDKDFRSLTRLDHTKSYGVVILPTWQGKPSRKKAIASALRHFSDTLTTTLTKERGIVVHYTANGFYKISKPNPSLPTQSLQVATGQYAIS